ncbi:MAG: hypothetical protein ACLFV4_08100, partial [Candidatus Hydrogenedentota bacterium]
PLAQSPSVQETVPTSDDHSNENPVNQGRDAWAAEKERQRYEQNYSAGACGCAVILFLVLPLLSVFLSPFVGVPVSVLLAGLLAYSLNKAHPRP